MKAFLLFAKYLANNETDYVAGVENHTLTINIKTRWS